MDHGVLLNFHSADTTAGSHAALLAKVNDALVAFQDDLKLLGLENRVMGVTLSEFGRRILSNASLGTDHGTSAPLFVWGAGVQGGLLGTNPSIPATVTVKDNIPMQYDYRSVYASILKDWLGVGADDLAKVMVKDFPALPIVATPVLPHAPAARGEGLEANYPNPFRGATTLRWRVGSPGRVRLRVFDLRGQLIRNVVDEFQAAGAYARTFEAAGMAPGTYVCRLEAGENAFQRTLELAR